MLRSCFSFASTIAFSAKELFLFCRPLETIRPPEESEGACVFFPLGTAEGGLDSEPLELSTYCKEECWVCFSILKFTLKKRKSSFHIKFLLSSIWGLKVWCS